MKCEKLDIWKDAVALSVDVYKNSSHIKDYGFKDQLTRACRSIPSNIAEGMERASIKEQIRFLDIAKSSAAEFLTQVHIGTKVGFLEEEYLDSWGQKVEAIMRRTAKLIQYLEAKK